jgi:hypothetical protein
MPLGNTHLFQVPSPGIPRPVQAEVSSEQRLVQELDWDLHTTPGYIPSVSFKTADLRVTPAS